MKLRNLIIAAALASPAMLFAAPASAQVSGIATVDQMRAILGTKAFNAASQQINTNFKPAIDQINARRTAEQQEVTPLIAAIDTNHDQQISEQELQAAQSAKNPALAKIQTARENADKDVNRIQQPMLLAQAYASELLLQQYEGAQNRVVAAKKVGVILTPEAFIYAPDSVDITPAVTAELDKAVPSVPITPPANWQPQQGTLLFMQRLNEMAEQAARARAAQGQRPAAPAAAGARPPATTPARPATTPPTTPPQSR